LGNSPHSVRSGSNDVTADAQQTGGLQLVADRLPSLANFAAVLASFAAKALDREGQEGFAKKAKCTAPV
jgi:hypothetical protein